jgi:TRAP transporter 4TM/12TM fusion protein
MEKARRRISFVLAVCMSLFHLYTGWFGVLENMKQRPIHLAFILSLAFLNYPVVKRKGYKVLSFIVDLILILIGFFVPFYLYSIYSQIPFKAGSPSPFDIWLGFITIALVLDATRRVIGWALPLLAIFFLLYCRFGPLFPEVIAHGGFSIETIMGTEFLTTEGLYGVALGVSATYVVLFIIFGAFLKASGTGDFFIDASQALLGNFRGGAAKIAIFASCLFGTISGSPTANVVGVGTFTIPLMKRIGYKPHFAGAVEAVASTGGMFMPPVMGASAFIMAEVLGISYFQVCVAAAIPATLYYVALLFGIDFEAVKISLKGLPKSELPDLKKVFSNGFFFLLPIIILIYSLVVLQQSPLKVAIWAILGAAAVGFIPKKEKRLNIKKIFVALEEGAKQTIVVAVACAAAGVVIGSLMQTGLSMKLSVTMLDLSMGNLYLLMLFCMITSLILGMGLPAVACYVILAVFGAPALIKAGIPQIAAHLFVLYFGVISCITPPVAIAAYAAASVAGSDPMKTGFTAFRLGLAGYFIPFSFAIRPGLLMGGSIFQIVLSLIHTLVAVWALAAGCEGYLFMRMNLFTRGILILASILLVSPGMFTDMIGYSLIMVIALYLLITKLKLRKLGEPIY